MPPVDAQADTALTICSQNLERYGAKKNRKDKRAQLVQGFVVAGCEVIALQELDTSRRIPATELLNEISNELGRITGSSYRVVTGESNDSRLSLGFLIESSKAEIVKTRSYARERLPKLMIRQPSRRFVRGPLEITVRVKEGGVLTNKKVVLINFHFKSKHNFPRDPANLMWETYRMEMAEGLYRIVSARYGGHLQRGDVPIVLLGDRNSDQDSASADLLEGKLHLRNFQAKNECRVSKSGKAFCKSVERKAGKFLSALLDNPGINERIGTYTYKKRSSWIDDILVSTSFLVPKNAELASKRSIFSGVVDVPRSGSDHNMIFARLIW